MFFYMVGICYLRVLAKADIRKVRTDDYDYDDDDDDDDYDPGIKCTKS